MRIEAIEVKNFKALQNVSLTGLPSFCVFVGANGTGKSTLFQLFRFLKDALEGNINSALGKLGGGRGFWEVRSRHQSGPIVIELKFRPETDHPLATYRLEINQDKDSHRAYIARETLSYRRGSRGKPWHFLDYARGQGSAVTNEVENVTDVTELQREEQPLISDDILALKGLAQFQRFKAASSLGRMIESWHLSDFRIAHARRENEIGYAEHLSSDGDNLAQVLEYYFMHKRAVFDNIIDVMKRRIPGVANVVPFQTEDGKLLIRINDGAFPNEPFLARFVSDGTIKMLAYLALLYDPDPHPLLCVEEPENQLYPSLMAELAEEFRNYSHRIKQEKVEYGQVFVTSHSYDFVNAIDLDEAFILVKKDGYTNIVAAKDNDQVKAYMENGDKLGWLWREGFFIGADPK